MNGTSPRIRITVKCLTCHERHMTIAKPYARKMKCPECEATINVPAYDPVEAEFRKRLAEPRNVDPGVYGISRIEISDVDKIPEIETVSLKCPQCLTLLTPELRDESWRDTCPDCLEEYRVPARSEIPAKPKPIPIPDPGQYAPGAVSKPTPLNTHVFESISQIKQVEVDPPPKWVFFSNVFNYPWTTRAWPKWIWTSIAWSISWVMVTISLQFLMAAGVGVLVAAMIGLPSFWVVFWTLSYSSACGMTILEGTGSGQVVIDEWPEPDWREWGVNLLYVAFLGLVAQGISLLLEPLAQFLPAPWLVSLVQVHMIYPIILLSALESGSIFWPVSLPVYHSFWSHGRYWVSYYLLAGLFSSAYVTAVIFSIYVDPILCVLWLGPLTASFLFVHARLLGRLGWRVLIEPDGGKKRLAKMEKIRRYKEEPFGDFEPVPPESQSS